MSSHLTQLETTGTGMETLQSSIKSIFFIYYAAMAAYFPFLTLYLKRLGLSGSQIGVIMAAGPVTTFLAGPLWGIVADVKGRQREVFTGCSFAAALVALLYIRYSSFALLLGVQILFGVLISPLIPITDSTALTLQGEGDLDYGRCRIFGSIGFATLILAFGYLAQVIELYVLFWFLAGALLVTGLLGFRLPRATVRPVGSIRETVRLLLKGRQLFFFLMTSLLMRTGSTAAVNYYSIYLDYLGAGEGITGLSWSAMAYIEIPFFFFSTRILRRFNTDRVLVMAYMATALQLLLYCFARSVPLAVIVHILHGVVFSTFYVSGIHFVRELTPERLRTTGQMLFGGAVFGLSGLLGNLAGGLAYQYLGINAVYIVAATLSLLAAGLLALVLPAVRGEQGFTVRKRGREA